MGDKVSCLGRESQAGQGKISAFNFDICFVWVLATIVFLFPNF